MAKKKIVLSKAATCEMNAQFKPQVEKDRNVLEAIEDRIKACEAELARAHEAKAVAIRLGIAGVLTNELDKLRMYNF